ncbi:MAG: response regulator, partial [Cyanobacteria bacterium J083]
MRILVIEDDEVLLDVLENSLTNQRYIVDVAEDGRFGLECALGTDYDLILTDVGLPLMDGVTLCQRLRKEGYTTPILLMTAKDAPEERIKGLDAGADDYLVKPLDLGELHARVRALLRRGEVKPHNILEVAGLKLDPVSCQVTYQEKPIKLTPKEYGILEIFLRNPSRVYSRGQIIDALWSFDDPPLEDSVKAHIKGLRQKLKKAGLVDWIENVYGLGYRLNPHLENNQAITNADKSSVEVEFSQAMAALWQKHQPLMQERMNLLQEAVKAIQSNNLNPGVQQAAEKAAHKLAGVLGMFKREGGTQIAREIESLLGQNPQLTPAQQQNFLLLVSQLEDLLGLDNNISVRTITPAELLLISSEPELGDRLQQLAPSIGKKWQQVENIEAAKNWLKTNSPHLIVLESEKQSQWQNDLAFIQKITTSNPKISVIVLTDTDELDKRITASTAGANGFLVKPLTPTMLSSAVNQQLQQISGQSTKVLIVDDDPIILDTVVTILEPWGMQVTSLVNPEEFWQTLQTTNPDLVILDIDMPKISGIELCQAVRT